jgi:hypothetical protein
MEEGNSSKAERDLIKTTKSKTCLLDLGIAQISNTCPWKKMNLTWKSRLLELDHIVLCPSARERS